MEEGHRTSYICRSKKSPDSRFARIRAFTSSDDFIKRLEFHVARVAKAETKSLKQLAASDKRAKTGHDRIVATWVQARILLVDAVREIDAAINQLDLGLSMADDISHEGLAGAVEVRLYRMGGGLPRSLLDIEVDLDGWHSTRVQDTGSPVQVKLPPVGKVRREDYRYALMAFVYDVMRTTTPRAAERCPHCAQPALSFPKVGGTTFSDEDALS